MQGTHLDLARRIDRLTRLIALAGFSGLVVMVLLTVYDGAARYLGMPQVSGFRDDGELVYPIVIASCFPAVLLRQKNVTIRLLGNQLGKRGNMVLEAMSGVMTLAFFGILAWQFLKLTLYYAEAGRTTPTIELPLAPTLWLAFAIMALCVPVQCYVTLSWMLAALTGRAPGLRRLNSD